MKLRQVANKLNVGIQLLNELLGDCHYNPGADITEEQYHMLIEKVNELDAPLTGDITETPEDHLDEILKFLVNGLHKDQIPAIIAKGVARHIKVIHEQSLIKNTISSWTNDELVNVEKLFMLHLLFNEKDRQEALIYLCDLMVLSGKTTSNRDLHGLARTVENCLCNKPINKLNFSRINIFDKVFSHPYCLGLIQNIIFEDTAKERPALIYEGNGTVIYEDGQIIISSQNYRKSRKLETAFSILDLVQVKTAGNDKNSYVEIKDIEELLKDFRQQQRSMTPSYSFSNTVKDYKYGDFLLVKVTDAGYFKITAESIDPAFHQISKSLDTQNLNFYYKEYIKKAIINAFIDKKEFYLKVKVTESGFTLQDTLEEYISDKVMATLDPQDALCISVFKNRRGLRWLTSEGLIVNVLEQDCSENDIGKYDIIEGISADTDNNGNFCLNAEYSDESCEEAPDWFYITPWKEAMEETLKHFAEGFLYAIEPPKQEPLARPLHKEHLKAFAHVLYWYSLTIRNSVERMKLVGTARLLAITVSSDDDISYLKFEQNYLSRLIAFAKGESDKRKLRIDVPEELKDIRVLQEKANICGQLSEYEVVDIAHVQDEVPPLHRLIEASNALNGILGLEQIDVIKRKIAASLHVEDEYCSIVPKSTEEEGKDIEYKTSVIYSPLNMKTPEYDCQMGRILKTICAFLNSENGGTLVIGETDDHAINGFMGDIRQLKADKRIKTLNKDDYWLYLKKYIDSAFKEDSGFARDKEITGTLIEKNYIKKNGIEVLVINVQPYVYDIVEFAADLDGLKGTAWYRSDANTLEMTLEMRHQVLRKKRLKWDDVTEKTRRILEAKKNQMSIIFKDYPSKNRTKDRNVEAYYVFQDIDAVICYDLDDRKNKEYKISRIGKVEFTDQPWRNQLKHRSEPKVDIFKMLEQEKGIPYHIVLRLSPYAKTLLTEEFPRSRSLMEPSRRGTRNRLTESVDKQYWTLETDVYRLESVGRFCMGLMNQVSIVEGVELKTYIKGIIAEYQKTL